MLDLGTAVGYLMLDTSGFRDGFKDADSQMKSFLDKSSSLQDRMGSLGGVMAGVGKNLTTFVTLPLIGAGAAMVSFAGDMESAMSQFSAQTGILTDDMSKYKDVMDEIYTSNYGESYQDVALAMATVVNLLGEMDPSNLQSVTESAIALRDTFGYDISESIRAVDTLMKNFGLTADEAFDFIVKGAQEGLDFSGEFLDSINEYSVQFKKIGFDANDMFSIFKAGAEGGAFNLDKASDAVKEFSIRVIDGSQTTAEGFAAIGLNADEMAQKFAAGGETAKQAWYETLDALMAIEDPVQQNIAGVALFGTMWEDLGPEVIFQMGSIRDEAIDTKGSMDALKEVKYDNLQSAISALGRSFQSLGAELGTYLIPKVEAVINFVDGLREKFDSLDPSVKEGIVNVGLVVAAIGPLLLIGGKLLTTVASIQTAVTTLGPMISGLIPAFSSLALPIAAVVAVIAALFVAWQTDFMGMRDTVAGFAEQVTQIISSFLSLLKLVWDENFLGIQDVVRVTFEVIVSYIQGALDIIQGIINLFTAIVKGDWKAAWMALIDILKAVFNTMFNVMDAIFGDLTDAIAGKAADFLSAGKELFNSLLDGMKSVWDSIYDWVTDKIDWLVDKITFWDNESKNFSGPYPSEGGRVSGSYAAGLDYVSRDMTVQVHEGESIWTKNQTTDFLNMMSSLMSGYGAGGDLNVNLVVDGRTLYRTTIHDFRTVDAETPQVKDDF